MGKTSSQGKQAPAPKRREEAFFGLHFDLHPRLDDTELGARVTPEMVRRIIRATRCDYLQYDCKGHPGVLGYPAGAVSASPPAMAADPLAIYRKATAEMGVALFVHFSGVWDDQACRDHPEWSALDAAGQPYPRGRTSTFSDYVHQRMIPQMKEVVDRYQVDGFWVDGDCWAAEIDYHPAAVQRFCQLTAAGDAPRQPGQPLWLEWMGLQREQFFNYLRTYLEAMRLYAPRVQVASNWLYSNHVPEPVKVPVDFISGDYSPENAVNSARFNARQLANVGLPWDLMAWAFCHHAQRPTLAYKPAQQLQQEAAIVLALGGGFQLYFHPDRHSAFSDAHIRLMKDVAEFCHARKDLCFRSQPVPQVGILLDSSSYLAVCQRVYAPHAGEYQALEGLLHATLEAGHSADVIADHQLPWQQDHWPVIAVPEWEQVPPAVVYELAEYVRRGGNLLLVGAVTCGLFREHLGVDFGPLPTEQAAQLQVESRLTRGPSGAVLLKGLWQDVSIPVGSDTRVLAYRTPGYLEAVERTPAATLRRLGKGRVAAIFGPLGRRHLDMHHPLLRDFVGAVLSKLYRRCATVRSANGAHRVDLVLREKLGRRIVHLCNVAAAPAANQGYLFVDAVPATPELTLELRCPARPRRLRLEPAGKNLRFTWRAGVVKVTVPPVHIHAAVTVE